MVARSLSGLVLAALASGCAPAGASGPRVVDAWSHPTAPDAAAAEVSPAGELGPGVAYFTVVNDGPADRLIGLATASCRSPELHRTELVDGRARMVEVAGGLEVPAGGRVELAPGGLHVMLVGLRRDLVPGESFELELRFERAGTVRVPVAVRAP